jgi:hypothetical protein
MVAGWLVGWLVGSLCQNPTKVGRRQERKSFRLEMLENFFDVNIFFDKMIPVSLMYLSHY